MIAFRDFALRQGGRLLLSGVDAVLHAGSRVGVVGRNGSGKSSLFAAIQGRLEADAGSLDLPAGLRLAAVAQETPALPDAAIDYVLGGDVELAAALAAEVAAQARGDDAALVAAHLRIETLHGYDARARAARLLHGLGFAADTQTRAVATFSGGWRVRLNLARALMAPSDLLLLDEPTNHLDLDAVLWLEEWLRRYPGTLLVISHDRDFLDGVISHTLHLHEGRARLYAGDYTAFERQRAEQLRLQQITHDKEQAERAHLQSFIDRFKAKATKAKQAQSRMKRLQKLAGTEAVRAERTLHFEFPQPVRVPTSLLKLAAVEAGYAQTPVLRQVRFALQAGDRIGLLGANGAGKSTLVKTLVGELPPLAGERIAHKDLRIGYFAQHTVESLRAGTSPFDHLREQAPQATAQEVRDWLGRWDFAGDRAFEPVDVLSGGERARLALALIAWTRPNLLLLDEPTNHLDLDMREALADALNDFPGALVLVSHDRHLLGLVCDGFWRVADGTVTAFDGDLDDYARWLRGRDAVATSPRGRGGAEASGAGAASSRERRRDAAGQRERLQPLRRQLQRIEQRLAAIAAECRGIEQRLADPEVYAGDGSEATQLGQALAALRREQGTLEAEWLQLYEQIEAASA
ncbi:MAG TPA: ATP-binding cassette domain-containing protein [Rhodanobacteraceae bacterium]|nr:ATP-binding cassette domain-containing protein [Rhodanobacteraceae bacterium]